MTTSLITQLTKILLPYTYFKGFIDKFVIYSRVFLHYSPGFTPDVLAGSVLLIFLVFCVVFLFVSFVFALCLVYPMFLDYPFVVTPSISLTFIY